MRLRLALLVTVTSPLDSSRAVSARLASSVAAAILPPDFNAETAESIAWDIRSRRCMHWRSGPADSSIRTRSQSLHTYTQSKPCLFQHCASFPQRAYRQSGWACRLQRGPELCRGLRRDCQDGEDGDRQASTGSSAHDSPFRHIGTSIMPRIVVDENAPANHGRGWCPARRGERRSSEWASDFYRG